MCISFLMFSDVSMRYKAFFIFHLYFSQSYVCCSKYFTSYKKRHNKMYKTHFPYNIRYYSDMLSLFSRCLAISLVSLSVQLFLYIYEEKFVHLRSKSQNPTEYIRINRDKIKVIYLTLIKRPVIMN